MRILLSCFLILNSLLAFSFDTLTANVKVGSRQFTIKLPANPTTGFQWTVKQYDNTFLQLAGSQYVPPLVQRFGAGGNMVFTFSLIKGATYPQSTTMFFNYARGWEANGGEMREVIVNFK